jgi:type IV pilus assembly protein PilO
MAARSENKSIRERLLAGRAMPVRDPRFLLRVALGVLLLANVAAALALFRPWEESPEEMEQRLGRLRAQVQQQTRSVERLEKLVEKARQAREEGDAFIAEYFMDRQTASSAIVSELKDSAAQAGVKQEEHTFTFEPVDGSDAISMMTVSGNYEGRYEDLLKFINLLDRSPRFLILDTLTAAPERTAGLLTMNFKMNAFVMEGKAPHVPEPEAGGAPEGDGQPEAPPAPETSRQTVSMAREAEDR